MYCSIRQLGVTETTNGWQRYTGCPTIDSQIIKEIHSKRSSVLNDKKSSTNRIFSKITDSKISTEFSEDMEGQKKQKALCITLPEQSPYYMSAVSEVRRFDQIYSHVIIRSVMTTHKQTYFRVCVRGEGSSVCFNLTADKKEHNNNSVYFIIKPSGVYQRCWCTCDTIQNRKFGQCKKFTSGANELLALNLITLFPNHKSEHAPLLESPLRINQTNNDAESKIIARLWFAAYADSESVSKPSKKKRKTIK
jgi:hypothetical protein